ncbi:hypothetical protein ACJMK2_024639 [Sinanodonta woodiana]|uniref:C2H2-type domain-containing protein n=1 Tax=Sinanodonta woodiana TaxID=1069815 RepID=A0ABD3XE00_SINWO
MSHMREPDFSQPDMKEAMKSVLKYEIQTLIERLSEYGVESVLITASIDQCSHGHIASQKGDKFTKFKNVEDLEQQFLCFCTGAALYHSEKNDTHASKNQRWGSHDEGSPIHERRLIHKEAQSFPRDFHPKRHKGSHVSTTVPKRTDQLAFSAAFSDSYESPSNPSFTQPEQIVIDPVTNTMYKQTNPDMIKSEPFDPDFDNLLVSKHSSEINSILPSCSEETCSSIAVLDLEALSGSNPYMDLEGPLPGSVFEASVIKESSSNELPTSKCIDQSSGNKNTFRQRHKGPNVSLQAPARFQSSTFHSSFTDEKSQQKDHGERESQSPSAKEESKMSAVNQQDTHKKEMNDLEASIKDLQEQNHGHFWCPSSECGVRFDSEFLFQEHMKSHTNCLLYACPQCNKTFENRFSLTKHMRNCGQKFTCRMCGKVYSTQGSLWHHQQVHKVGRYRCNCGLTYAYRTGLARHRTMSKH